MIEHSTAGARTTIVRAARKTAADFCHACSTAEAQPLQASLRHCLSKNCYGQMPRDSVALATRSMARMYAPVLMSTLYSFAES